MTTRHQLRQQLGTPVPDRDKRDWVFSAELEAEAGISYRQVDYWTRTGLLYPLATDITPGSGHARRFPEHQIRRAQCIKALVDVGFSFLLVRAHIDDFLADGQITLGAITITIQSGDTAA